MKKLDRDFYRKNSIELAKDLLGKILVFKSKGEEISFKIVETEAYMGVIDKAAHSYGGKKTERTRVMFGECGFAYVYIIYGMYYCLNIVAAEEGNPEAVLIRAAEPLDGLKTIIKNRYNKEDINLSKKELINISSGPGKLCKAANITKEHNGLDLCGDIMFLCDPLDSEKLQIVKSKRINIDYAEEAKDFLWRFYIKDNKFVSKRDKIELIL